METKRPVLLSLSNNVPENNDRQGLKLSAKKKSPPFKENSPASKSPMLSRNINQVKRNLQFGNIAPEVKKEVLKEKLTQPFVNEQKPFAFNTSAGSSFFRVQNSQVTTSESRSKERVWRKIN